MASNQYFKSLFLLLIVLTFIQCRNKGVKDKEIAPSGILTDTIIEKMHISNEIAGASYRKKTIKYFLVVNKDTSEFKPVFFESKDSGKVFLDLNLPYNQFSSFHKTLNELEKILPEASRDFNLDSLNGIFLGRLVQTGELAVNVTKQYIKEFGGPDKISTQEYSRISNFLKESALSEEINTLFQPYSLSVDHISIEKVFFTSRENFLSITKVEMDTTDIPDKIMDCQTWITLAK